jgi:hypothetical protein
MLNAGDQRQIKKNFHKPPKQLGLDVEDRKTVRIQGVGREN